MDEKKLPWPCQDRNHISGQCEKCAKIARLRDMDLYTSQNTPLTEEESQRLSGMFGRK